MNTKQFAQLGDTIETTVKNPVPGMLRVRLDTPHACAEGNKLLMDASSGWRLASLPQTSNS